MSTFDTVKAEEILTASPMLIRMPDGRLVLKDALTTVYSRRPAPVRLCPTCDGKKTLGSWDGKGGFTYVTCDTCKGEGTLPGPQWGICRHCQKQLSLAYNCCTSCADERGP